jgi:hypothetical protein
MPNSIIHKINRKLPRNGIHILYCTNKKFHKHVNNESLLY